MAKKETKKAGPKKAAKKAPAAKAKESKAPGKIKLSKKDYSEKVAVINASNSNGILRQRALQKFSATHEQK